MIESLDSISIWEKEQKIIASKQLNIPALHMMGHARFVKAAKPLVDHYHKDKLEIVVVIHGSQTYTLENHTYQLTGGDVFVSFPNEPHSSGQLPQTICEFIWFQLDLSTSDNFLGLAPPFNDYFYSQIIQYNKRVNKISTNHSFLLIQAFNHLSSNDSGIKLLGYTQFLNFLSELTTIQAPLHQITEDILRTKQYIQNNINNYMDFNTLCSISQLSISRLKTKFKAQVGITPREYINTLKIEQAKTILLKDNISITEIAYQLNFASSNYFSSVFKKYTGITPTDYRKLENQ